MPEFEGRHDTAMIVFEPETLTEVFIILLSSPIFQL